MYILNAYGWKHLLYCTAFILYSDIFGSLFAIGIMFLFLALDNAYWKLKEIKNAKHQN